MILFKFPFISILSLIAVAEPTKKAFAPNVAQTVHHATIKHNVEQELKLSKEKLEKLKATIETVKVPFKEALFDEKKGIIMKALTKRLQKIIKKIMQIYSGIEKQFVLPAGDYLPSNGAKDFVALMNLLGGQMGIKPRIGNFAFFEEDMQKLLEAVVKQIEQVEMPLFFEYRKKGSGVREDWQEEKKILLKKLKDLALDVKDSILGNHGIFRMGEVPFFNYGTVRMAEMPYFDYNEIDNWEYFDFSDFFAKFKRLLEEGRRQFEENLKHADNEKMRHFLFLVWTQIVIDDALAFHEKLALTVNVSLESDTTVAKFLFVRVAYTRLERNLRFWFAFCAKNTKAAIDVRKMANKWRNGSAGFGMHLGVEMGDMIAEQMLREVGKLLELYYPEEDKIREILEKKGAPKEKWFNDPQFTTLNSFHLLTLHIHWTSPLLNAEKQHLSPEMFPKSFVPSFMAKERGVLAIIESFAAGLQNIQAMNLRRVNNIFFLMKRLLKPILDVHLALQKFYINNARNKAASKNSKDKQFLLDLVHHKTLELNTELVRLITKKTVENTRAEMILTMDRLNPNGWGDRGAYTMWTGYDYEEARDEHGKPKKLNPEEVYQEWDIYSKLEFNMFASSFRALHFGKNVSENEMNGAQKIVPETRQIEMLAAWMKEDEKNKQQEDEEMRYDEGMPELEEKRENDKDGKEAEHHHVKENEMEVEHHHAEEDRKEVGNHPVKEDAMEVEH